MPAAAVVIPTRNRRNDLERAIRSVESQTLRDWEAVVVDDASSDDTPDFLAALADPRVRIERLPSHAERSVARNRGLELVGSPGVLFLDDDDELLPGALEVLTRTLARHDTACASIGAAIYEIDGLSRRPSFPKRPQVVGIRLELLAGWVALGGQSLMRTEMLREIGGWEENDSVIPAEDQELWLRLSSRGPAAITPEAVLHHRQHGRGSEAFRAKAPERFLITRYLRTVPPADGRARHAARARDHLRSADINFQMGGYRAALVATVRGIATAPFLLRSPLVGPGLRAGLGKAVVAGLLPRPAADRLRSTVKRLRTRATSA